MLQIEMEREHIENETASKNLYIFKIDTWKSPLIAGKHCFFQYESSDWFEIGGSSYLDTSLPCIFGEKRSSGKKTGKKSSYEKIEKVEFSIKENIELRKKPSRERK